MVGERAGNLSLFWCFFVYDESCISIGLLCYLVSDLFRTEKAP